MGEAVVGSPSDRSVVDELRELLVDWNGADIPDSSLPRIDILCGTLRRAADLIEARAREVARKDERIEALKAEVSALPVECSQAATDYLRERGDYGWALTAEGIRGAISEAIRARTALATREEAGL